MAFHTCHGSFKGFFIGVYEGVM